MDLIGPPEVLRGILKRLGYPVDTQGIEAGTAETERLGAKPESPVGGHADAPNPIGEWRA